MLTERRKAVGDGRGIRESPGVKEVGLGDKIFEPEVLDNIVVLLIGELLFNGVGDDGLLVGDVIGAFVPDVRADD